MTHRSRPVVLIVLGVLVGCADPRSAPPAPKPVEPVITIDAAPAPVAARTAPTTPAPTTPAPTTPASPATPALEGHEFITEARALFRVAACGGDDPIPARISPAVVAAHCARLAADQAELRRAWVEPARAFFATVVPADAPRVVVYPFAGGDLHTALTVFPEADELTTISLEPAGDPRSLAALAPPALARELTEVGAELRFLYKVSFSNTMDLIDTMRIGKLPGQLVFSLAALRLHGLAPVSLRYFRLERDGRIHYLDDAELGRIARPGAAMAKERNRAFANMELRFARPGDDRVRIYRHIQGNLDDAHQNADDRLLRHLAAKGKVSIMTKAAAYLLSWSDFSRIRAVLVEHLAWMVSDASGVPPAIATAAGFEQITYGRFAGAHMKAGHRVQAQWRELFGSQPERPLDFRFGYYDIKHQHHLAITRPR